jgi:hypothetical protein
MKIENEVLDAIKNRISFSGITKFVSAVPILTSHGNGRILASSGDFAPDPDHEDDFIEFWKYKDFIYWKLDEKKDAVSIIGIAWDEQADSAVFYALIFPPR